MKLLLFLLIQFVAKQANSLDYGVTWQSDNWAYACDFKSTDLSNKKTDNSKCAAACASTSGCTHFTWTSYLGGTCWMKSGIISKSNAFYTNDYTMICGILNTAKSGPLLWSDEFNSNQVNTSNWKFDLGNGVNGWGNYESQYYTSTNAINQNGNLKIQAKRETINSFKYTSARLVSRTSFKYGVFEARIKLPKGKGLWSAFWLLSDKIPLNWPQDGEIDIMENVGRDPNGIHMNIHCDAYSAKTGNNRGTYTSLASSDIYHIYKVDWNTNRIKFFIDGIEYFTYYKHMNIDKTWPYDSSFNIILNLAIGGGFGGEIDESIFPTELAIDYVRVYSASTETYPSVSIKAKANNKYVSADDSGSKALIANRDSVGSMILEFYFNIMN